MLQPDHNTSVHSLSRNAQSANPWKSIVHGEGIREFLFLISLQNGIPQDKFIIMEREESVFELLLTDLASVDIDLSILVCR